MKCRVSIGHIYPNMDFVFDSWEEASVFITTCLACCTDKTMKIEITNATEEEDARKQNGD